MNQLKEILLQRLEKKGIQPGQIPGLIKSIARGIPAISRPDLVELNRTLHLLGWYDFELDDHTFQLVLATLEDDGAIDLDQSKSNLCGYVQPR